MKTTILLGAGFSYNAGLPLVDDIASYFLSKPLHEYLINFTSGEWKWKKYATSYINQPVSGELFPFGRFLQELVLIFNRRKKRFLYEEFIGWLHKIPEEDINLAINNVKKEIKEFYWSQLNQKRIIEIVYDLIGNLLYLRKEPRALDESYSEFTSFVSECQNIKIVSLNHDLVLETLLYQNNIPYSDGFSYRDSLLMSDETKKTLEVYSSDFNQSTHLYKLHGSINWYKYNAIINNIFQEDDFFYFKADRYRDKQRPLYYNNKGKVIQDITPDIYPKIITGTDKKERLENDYMFKDLFFKSEKAILESEKLIIIGYSYQDHHIEDILKKKIYTPKVRVININPNATFPYSAENIININPLKEEVFF